MSLFNKNELLLFFLYIKSHERTIFSIKLLFIHFRILQKRETELRRRREHVEKLLNWHQRLDIEEREVIKMEQMIMLISTTDAYQTTTSHEQINDSLAVTVQHRRCKRTQCKQHDEISMHEQSLTNVTATSMATTVALDEHTKFEQKKQKQIHKIEKSLNTLKMISARSQSSDIDGSNTHLVDNIVEIFGRQLNKLWKRLTGQSEEKFTSDKVYKLTKYDLEQLYEQAKTFVLQQFQTNDKAFKKRLIENSTSCIDDSNEKGEIAATSSDLRQTNQDGIVPALNLASSPEPSNNSQQRDNVISDNDQCYYFPTVNIQQSEDHEKLVNVDDKLRSILPNVEWNETNISAVQEDVRSNSSYATNTPSNRQDSEDVQSDITEDSLNRPQTSFADESIPSQIENESHFKESPVKSSISTVAAENNTSDVQSIGEVSHSSAPFELNFSTNKTQMIEDTAFPHIDVTTIILPANESDTSIATDISETSEKNAIETKTSQSDEQKYQSDDFCEIKTVDDNTVASAVIESVETTTTIDEQLTENQSKSSLNENTPKELEQRLIVIDESLKELNDRLSQSPVLQNYSSGESNKSTENSQSEEITAHSPENEENLANSKNSDETKESSETVVDEQKSTIETPKNDSDESSDSIAAEIAASRTAVDQTTSESSPQKRPYQYSLSASTIDYNKMPEADALKRSQLPLEPDVSKKIIISVISLLYFLLKKFFSGKSQ